MNSVVIEQAEIISPLGNLQETVTNLIDGNGAITAENDLALGVPFAPFRDLRFRQMDFCINWLLKHCTLIPRNFAQTILVYCSAKGDIRSLEEFVLHDVIKSPVSPLLDKQAQEICEHIGLDRDKKIVISNACASGAAGIEVACELLQSKRFIQAIIVGFDCLSSFTATGFSSLNALSKNGACPFSLHRDGLTMGEGAGIALLSFRPAFSGDLVICGTGSSNDANHRTGPSRTGEGLFRAAQAALLNASYTAGKIGGVKCHGTATIYNDAMEAKALHLLFDQIYPPCVSFKGAIGHLSGASSFIELLIMGECLKRRILPPTIGYGPHGVDEDIPVSSLQQTISKPIGLCLSAGFGGVNSATIIEVKD